MTETTQDKLIEKIKKILRLASNNPNEAEAAAALLKAQKLMAEYNISIDMTDTEQIAYSKEMCLHKWNMGFRKPLAAAIAPNFRCKFFLYGQNVVFFGRAEDARIAREIFEYAYEFILKEGNRHYNKAYSMGKPTRGVFNSYASGFISGLKSKFEEQSTALMIVVPEDVKEKFDDMSKDWKVDKSRKMRYDSLDYKAYAQGYHDGQTLMNGRRLKS